MQCSTTEGRLVHQYRGGVGDIFMTSNRNLCPALISWRRFLTIQHLRSSRHNVKDVFCESIAACRLHSSDMGC